VCLGIGTTIRSWFDEKVWLKTNGQRALRLQISRLTESNLDVGVYDGYSIAKAPLSPQVAIPVYEALILQSFHNFLGSLQLIVAAVGKCGGGPGHLNVRLDTGAFESMAFPSYVLGSRHDKHVAAADLES
jgi:hypothetical protein